MGNSISRSSESSSSKISSLHDKRPNYAAVSNKNPTSGHPIPIPQNSSHLNNSRESDFYHTEPDKKRKENPTSNSIVAKKMATAANIKTGRRFSMHKSEPSRLSPEAYNSTEAASLLQAHEHVTSLPKDFTPCLAAYNDTEAMSLLEAPKCIDSSPKLSKPFMTAYNNTVPIALEVPEYYQNLPKAPRPHEAQYYDAISSTLLREREYTESLQTQILYPRELIQNVTTAPEPHIVANDETIASSSLEKRNNIDSLSKACQTSPTADDETIAADNSTAPAALLEKRNVTAKAPIVTAATSTAYFNKPQQQRTFDSQKTIKKTRNRCDYWPTCTNKNCKYIHPTDRCRAGDSCSFGNRCSYLHPRDLKRIARRPRLNY